MKSTTLLLIGGLAFAGTALAGDPTPQQTSTGSSLKVGYDRKTGKLRPLTAEESAALDKQAATRKTVTASGSRTASAQSARPATMDDALRNLRVVKGITGFKMPAEMMSSVTATRNADGAVTLSESGEPMQAPKARETASE